MTIKTRDLNQFSVAQSDVILYSFGQHDQRNAFTDWTYHGIDPAEGRHGCSRRFRVPEAQGKSGPVGNGEANVGELDVPVVGSDAKLFEIPIYCHRGYLRNGKRTQGLHIQGPCG